MSRTETIMAKFKGAVTDAKRTVLIFENLKNPKFDLRYAAFPPHIPVLEPGKTYEFVVEHVPTGKSDGSEYHNIFREDKTSKYEIAEVAGTEAVTPPPPVPAPVLNLEQEK